MSQEKKLLLIGNPNVGKSLLFGCLTHRYVNVSNYPGTTVEITTAAASMAGQKRLVVDTPGTNGLIPQSDDERVARDMLITSEGADVIQVGDMSNMRRTLLLSLQIAEHEVPFTLCLNMSDEARERESEVDPAAISALLGVPVVATSALRRWNLEKLKRSAVEPRASTIRVEYPIAVEEGIARICGGQTILSVHDGQARLPVLHRIVRGLPVPKGRGLCGGQTILSVNSPGTGRIACPPYISRGIALSILAGDRTLARFVEGAHLDEIRAEVQSRLSHPLSVVIGNARMAAVERLSSSSSSTPEVVKRNTIRDWIGAVSIHPLWGVPFLAAVLYAAWLFVGKFGAGYLVDLLETNVFEAYINVWATSLVNWLALPQFLRDLLVGPYGVITMALTYAIAIVLPVVITFFFFFGVLEDSGYLPRLAVMLNRLMRRMGLNGKAVLPMVLGLGCDTMATLTTRILETRKEATIVTLLLALGVPCSAQLGVIMAMLGPLAPQATMIWLGVTVGTIFLVGLLASKVVRGQTGDFILEIPPVRVPKLSNIAIKVLARTEWYLKEAVPLFIAGTLLLYLLDAANLLGKLQELVAPLVVSGLGLPAEAANSFLIGFLRRDYGAAGLFAMQRAGQLDAVQTVVSLTVITLFIPCIANLLVILKERGTRAGLAIAGFILVYSFGIGMVMNATFRLLHVRL
ncbi:MAG TPA: ferrous iron transporter B [Thermoanaerobaculia bacterium]|nr:ferrous iron transporter B [Thermoanaerobaculia bacterium]